MKTFVVCAVLLASAAQAEVSSSLVQAAIRAKWSSYKAAYRKSYSSGEENLRMANYLDNTRTIEEHNARFHQGLESYELGHNEFSDMSLEEMTSTFMGVVEHPDAAEIVANASQHFAPSEVALPDSVDWRSEKCVQRVKNQGLCGSCYAFAAIGALESAYCIKHGRQELPDLSEQHVVDCAFGGCRGGAAVIVFDFLQRFGGAISTNQYPSYTAKAQFCQAKNKPKSVKVVSYKTIVPGDERQLMHAVVTIGPICVAYKAGFKQHSLYKSGIMDVPTHYENHNFHEVNLVGYGTENGKDFWLLKNSWGEGWGEKGFLRIARGKNLFNVNTDPVYPVVA